MSIEPISPRILLLELDGNPKTTVVYVYSPTNSSSPEEIEDFYTTLRATIEQVPLHNFLVIAGDLNSKLGSDEARFSFNCKTNRNGEMLIDFIQEFNLFISNAAARFDKIPSKILKLCCKYIKKNLSVKS